MLPAIHTKYILPHPLLQPFIRCFAIRKFDTNGEKFSKPIYPDHEPALTFFIRCKLLAFESINNYKPAFRIPQGKIPGCLLQGIQTNLKGLKVFRGMIFLLTICFRLAGIFQIFNILPVELLDNIYDASDILSAEMVLLQQRLNEIYDTSAIIILLESYLIKELCEHKQARKNVSIVKASCFLNDNTEYNIKKLAYDCNMSLQTFEVGFKEQTGLTPKQFLRIKRFNSAVKLKLHSPDKSWTDIAYSCGFYDQAHLIKDFKEFTLLSPRNFMITIHPPFENFMEGFEDT